MKRLIVIVCVVISFAACAVSRSQMENVEMKTVMLEERIIILEEQLRTIDSGNSGTADQIMALNNRINALEARQQQQEQVVVVTPVEHIPVSVMNEDVNNLYNEGRRQYETRNFAAAITTFQRVLDQSPHHDLAANAVYWMGESYYALADFTAAREQFQIIQDSYPASNKFIDAQVKIAMTWLRHGNRQRARTILEAIKRDFPNYERMNVVDQQLREAR